ncbi:hypothetical protein E4S40_02800 [Algoriphagus kandeliae]|uniref:Transcription regulator BetR N-terminal domain-containing protein n=1 Tax=Algoriphagus kandeliae TaxID=2562278 RepID=A0A4Y9R2D8_9BACT|nr:hypothetical protein [Algoriphagus kandeliae]TFV97596.1 hypothetical protein E4S40_02800 [Algoriphagus kandeliae]
MDQGNYTQVLFFQNIKSTIPSYSSLVDEVAETLDISMDSAYRRIRGEKLLDFQEIFLLTKKFNVSIDKFFSINSSSIVFQGNQNMFGPDNFQKWMLDVLAQLEMVSSFRDKHIYFLLKDMPPWYHYFHSELAAFKFFFWKKSILYNEDIKNEQFSISNSKFPELEEISRKILKTYNKIPSTEIWNQEGIQTTLRQIELYHKMGIISDKQDTIRLYQCMFEVINHLEKMAEHGKKFLPNYEPTTDSASYDFLVNEYVLGDNTFFVKLDETKITYLNYSVIYFIGTSDKVFNDGMFKNLENLIKKSTQISLVGELERKQFFNKLRKNIQDKIDNC